MTALGTYLPETVSAEEALRLGLYSQEDYEWFGWTGAAVAGNVPAPDMAVQSAHQAIERAGHQLSEIDVHLHAHSWPQGPAGWSPHHYILHHVTNRDIPSFLTWQACTGLMAGLEITASYLMAIPERTTALLTGADNVGTPDFNRWAFGLQNGVIGDGASAMLLSKKEGFASLKAVKSASTAELEQMYRGKASIFPPSAGGEEQVDFRERLREFGDDLGDTIAEVVSRQGELRTELALSTLAEAGIHPSEVTRVTHVFTGLESYLKVILNPIGLTPDQGLLEFGRQFGHLTVNDQFIGLDHLIATGQLGPGDHVLMIAHGGGTSIACAVLTIETHPQWLSGGETIRQLGRHRSRSSPRTVRRTRIPARERNGQS